jgi:hypothetical protein
MAATKAKKASTKKASAKKSTAKKSTAKTTGAKKSSAKKKTSTKAKKAGAWSSHPIIVTSPKNERTLARLRALCLAMPNATESINHGRPAFYVRDKTFVMFMDDHHRDGRLAIWCKAPPGAQSMIVEGDPERYFVPPYVGPSGWIGARLDRRPDWSAIEALVAESYAMTAAPKPRKR